MSCYMDPEITMFFSVTVFVMACVIELMKCRKLLEKNAQLLEEIAKKSR